MDAVKERVEDVQRLQREVDYIERQLTAKGRKAPKLREEEKKNLAKRQKEDGSWTNPVDRWFEGDPNLVTGFALMALSYCKPK